MISRGVGEWKGWQVKARRGVGQSRRGHHHLSPPPFLSSFSSWQGEWHSQPLSLKKPFLSSQSQPVLTEWRSEGKEKRKKRADEGIFQRGFVRFCGLVRTRGSAQFLGLKSDCGKSGGEAAEEVLHVVFNQQAQQGVDTAGWQLHRSGRRRDIEPTFRLILAAYDIFRGIKKKKVLCWNWHTGHLWQLRENIQLNLIFQANR